MNSEKPIQVLIVNDIPLMGRIIASMLEDEEDIEVVRCVSSKEEAETFIEKNDIDMVLINPRMKDRGALGLIQFLDETSPSASVVVYGIPEKENKVLPFLEAGADGYIRSDDTIADFVSTIRASHQGRANISPEITRALIERISELSELKTKLDPGKISEVELTPRELEVLECVGREMKNKEIAEELFIEVGTVKNHVHNILEKLNVSSRGEASQYLMYIKR